MKGYGIAPRKPLLPLKDAEGEVFMRALQELFKLEAELEKAAWQSEDPNGIYNGIVCHICVSWIFASFPRRVRVPGVLKNTVPNRARNKELTQASPVETKSLKRRLCPTSCLWEAEESCV